MSEIIVPPLGESIQEAIIASVQKNVGESVEVDEIIIELETDKVTLELNAPISGLIESLNVAEGDTVRVGQVIGFVNADSSAVQSSASEKPASNESYESSKEDLKEISSQVLSPAASRAAFEGGVNTDGISGSGKNGVVLKEDVLSAPAPAPAVSAPVAPIGDLEEVTKMSKLRKTIATRLKESQNTAAILTTFNEIDMSNVMALRSKHKDAFLKKHDVKLGFMSFFVKASTKILEEIPAINAEIRGENIIYKKYANVGVAVGTPSGLVVPVIRNAHDMDFAEIEKSILAYGLKARDNKISMADLQGGTFTISNGGTYGSLLSTPIINPPQSGILGMHNIVQRPIAVDGQVVIRPMMYVALSYDHRLIDGKEAVTFLVRLKQMIENPETLLLGL